MTKKLKSGRGSRRRERRDSALKKGANQRDLLTLVSALLKKNRAYIKHNWVPIRGGLIFICFIPIDQNKRYLI